MDPKYTEKLIDPANPDGKKKLRKYLAMYGAISLFVLVILVLNLVGIVSDLITGILVLPIGIAIGIAYFRVKGKDILD